MPKKVHPFEQLIQREEPTRLQRTQAAAAAAGWMSQRLSGRRLPLAVLCVFCAGESPPGDGTRRDRERVRDRERENGRIPKARGPLHTDMHTDRQPTGGWLALYINPGRDTEGANLSPAACSSHVKTLQPERERGERERTRVPVSE